MLSSKSESFYVLEYYNLCNFPHSWVSYFNSVFFCFHFSTESFVWNFFKFTISFFSSVQSAPVPFKDIHGSAAETFPNHIFSSFHSTQNQPQCPVSPDPLVLSISSSEKIIKQQISRRWQPNIQNKMQLGYPVQP